MAISPHFRFEKGMADGHHPPDAESQSDQDSYRQLTDHRTVPPVVPVAVIKEKSDFGK